MSTVDTFITADDAWSLVHHFLGNRLSAINLVTEDKSDGWDKVVEDNRVMLINSLRKIVERLSALGNVEESVKIDQIRQMVEDGDLTNPATIDAIHAKNLEYSESARAMQAKVKELFGNK